ncbi:hypothetical protein ACU4GD_14350 [Cupriavidus basilensis]
MNALQNDTSLEQVEMDNRGAELGVQPVRDFRRMAERQPAIAPHARASGAGYWMSMASTCCWQASRWWPSWCCSRAIRRIPQVQQLTTELNGVIGKVKTSYRGQYSKVSIAALKSNGVFKDLTTMTETGANADPPAGWWPTDGDGCPVAHSANDSLQWTILSSQMQPASPSSLRTRAARARSLSTCTTIKAVGGEIDPSKVCHVRVAATADRPVHRLTDEGIAFW